MLRYSWGIYLTDPGYDLRLIQGYLGHRDPKHTVHHTRTAARSFEGPMALMRPIPPAMQIDLAAGDTTVGSRPISSGVAWLRMVGHRSP